MADIKSFNGLIFNKEKVNIENVVAPPYDVINESEQNSFYEKDLNNVIRLILGRESDRYDEAKRYFSKWQNDGVLINSGEGIYQLFQTFKSMDGKLITRKGFVALVKIEEFEKGIILPHEKTLSKAKEDRLKLLRATNANFCQIFGLYSDPEKNIEKLYSANHELIFDLDFQNVRNQIWKISDKKIIDEIISNIKNKQILIADGHHRYETSLNYRNEMRAKNPNFTGEESFNYVMMFFTNLNDEGLVIFPTHRVIHSLNNFNLENFSQKLSENFKITAVENLNNLENQLKNKEKYAFGMIAGNPAKYFIIELNGIEKIENLIDKNFPIEVKDLDVVLLHNYILRDLLYISNEAQEKKININYLQNITDCKNEIENGNAQIAFIINPTKIDQVRSIAKAGFVMPQKSTFFYPKLISGLIFNKL